MHRQRSFQFLLPALTLTLLFLPTGRATTLARMSLEEMTAAAPVVARVRCVASAPRWEDGEIWTITKLEVLEVWKGRAPRQIAVRLLGGHLGHLISHVSGVPRFMPGEKLVLFLEPAREGDFSVVSWAQGTFRIYRNPRTAHETVTQETAGFGVFDPATRRFESAGIRGLPLEEFREQVISAAERRHGSEP